MAWSIVRSSTLLCVITTVRYDDTINAHFTIALFQQIEAQHAHAGNIHIVCDNARYYRSRLVPAYLENSKIQLEFLPPYAPNLNLIERYWKFFERKVRFGRYYSYLIEKSLIFMGCRVCLARLSGAWMLPSSLQGRIYGGPRQTPRTLQTLTSFQYKGSMSPLMHSKRPATNSLPRRIGIERLYVHYWPTIFSLLVARDCRNFMCHGYSCESMNHHEEYEVNEERTWKPITKPTSTSWLLAISNTFTIWYLFRLGKTKTLEKCYVITIGQMYTLKYCRLIKRKFVYGRVLSFWSVNLKRCKSAWCCGIIISWLLNCTTVNERFGIHGQYNFKQQRAIGWDNNGWNFGLAYITEELKRWNIRLR